MNKQPRPYLIPVICLLITSVMLSSCNLPVNVTINQTVLDTPTVGQQPLGTPPEPADTSAPVDTPASSDTPAAATTAAPVDTVAAVTTVTPTLTVTAGTPAADCDKAKYITDVNYPDDTVVKANEAFTKTWKIQNVGSCTWDTNYKLTFIRGEQMDGPSPADVFKTPVKPGEMVDVSIPLKASPKNGTHWGVWQLYNPAGKPVPQADGKPQEISVKILIKDGTGGKVTSIRGWRYTYVGVPCTSNVQYDVYYTIYVDGPLDVNYVWSTTNGVLTIVSQNFSFTNAGSQEVATHVSPPFGDPTNVTLTLTVNGGAQASFTICP